MNRYALITEKMPREMLLLVGSGCFWRKCTFCDYFNDTSANAHKTNARELSKVTGEFGVLDIINSGSCFELDVLTMLKIHKICKEKSIHTIWFESHWYYKDFFSDLEHFFSGITVKFRLGIETFDKNLRKTFNKGFPESLSPEEIAKHFKGVCLLVGVEGQTEAIIEKDIQIATKYFEYFSINVFNENTTVVKRDQKLVDNFVKNIAPKLKNHPKCEVLINNTDLGVG